jgi:ribosomal protein S27AE
MLLQSACRVVPSVLVRVSLRRPNCPACENVVLIAEHSRLNASGHIDHLWSCDECGNEFVTTVRLEQC